MMTTLNKFILCAMDKSKTIEEFWLNSDAALDICEAYNSTKDTLAYYVSDNAALMNESCNDPSDTKHSFERSLEEYFEITGESREDYDMELLK